MNAKRTSSGASRPSRLLFFATLLLSLMAGSVPQNAHASIGDALVLRANLNAAHLQSAATANVSRLGYTNLTNGRTAIDRQMRHSGAIRRANVASTNSVAIPNATQTFDINNPLPAFEPLIGYGTTDNLNNDSANSAVFITNLTPTNLTPVWSADQSCMVF